MLTIGIGPDAAGGAATATAAGADAASAGGAAAGGAAPLAAAGALAASPGRATSCRLSRPCSSRTIRAKKSLSAVSAIVTRGRAPGASATSMPRSDSDFQLSSGGPVPASRTIARPPRRVPVRTPTGLAARKSSTVASPRKRRGAGLRPCFSQATVPRKPVCAFCTSSWAWSSK